MPVASNLTPDSFVLHGRKNMKEIPIIRDEEQIAVEVAPIVVTEIALANSVNNDPEVINTILEDFTNKIALEITEDPITSIEAEMLSEVEVEPVIVPAVDEKKEVISDVISEDSAKQNKRGRKKK